MLLRLTVSRTRLVAGASTGDGGPSPPWYSLLCLRAVLPGYLLGWLFGWLGVCGLLTELQSSPHHSSLMVVVLYRSCVASLCAHMAPLWHLHHPPSHPPSLLRPFAARCQASYRRYWPARWVCGCMLP